jgi:hypothetical protein
MALVLETEPKLMLDKPVAVDDVETTATEGFAEVRVRVTAEGGVCER